MDGTSPSLDITRLHPGGHQGEPLSRTDAVTGLAQHAACPFNEKLGLLG